MREIKIIILTLIETDHPDFLPFHKLLHCQGSSGNLQASQFNTYILSNGGEKYKKTNKIKLTKENGCLKFISWKKSVVEIIFF